MSHDQPRRSESEQSEATQNEKGGTLDQRELNNASTKKDNTAGVVEQNSKTVPLTPEKIYEGSNIDITIGEALEATALTSGNRPVDFSDAAAIQAAEVRATGRTNIVPGGVAAAAQSAATRNARIIRDEEKTKLSEILADATAKLPSDKPVTRRDAEGVIGAELRNDPNISTHPGGVAASLAAAARINQSRQTQEKPK